MIGQLVKLLKQAELDLDAEQIADSLWLAQHIKSESSLVIDNLELTGKVKTVVIEDSKTPSLDSSPPVNHDITPRKTATAYPLESTPAAQQSGSKLPFWAPAARSLRHPLELGRSLRPLRRKVRSRTVQVIDEQATAEQIAATQMWLPTMQPAPERWLDLALVVEETSLIEVWRKTINEFQQLLEHLGAFRNVQAWTMRRSSEGKLELLARHRQGKAIGRRHDPKELIDPSQRRLILVVSDCTSVSWWQGLVHEWLKLWTRNNWVTVMQLLPGQLWQRGVLGEGLSVWLRAKEAEAKNTQWMIEGLPVWRQVETKGAVTFPVVSLDAEFLGRWAQMLAGRGEVQTAGVLFEPGWLDEVEQTDDKTSQSPDPELLVRRFQVTASPLAQRLAILMAAAPVNLRVVELIQETLLPESRQVHAAEVLMSGMLQPQLDTEPVQFEFVPGVRQKLRELGSRSQILDVLRTLSQYVAARTGSSLQGFAALLEAVDSATDEMLPFAEVTADVLRQMGGQYAAFAETLQERITDIGVVEPIDPVLIPPLQTFQFESVRVVFEEDQPSQGESELEHELEQFEFKVATIEVRRKRTWFGREQWKLVIQKQSRLAWQFVEALADGVNLEMVAIPSGKFFIGSPKDEPERYGWEGPQHRVSVAEFFIAKYPVTQAQWRVVAGLSKVEQELDPDPSTFKGENHPVENVSWRDAVEFCDRLSLLIGKQYRLPSEAEWEYAARAGTTTPFYFGETIAPELANYDWNQTYGSVKVTKKKDFQGTTPVGHFEVANAFGLYDMHGNVWEWCADHWHSSYEGAPSDGSAWIDPDVEKDARHILRGGSWVTDPWFCRSATRSGNDAGIRNYIVGFRVVCGVPRTS